MLSKVLRIRAESEDTSFAGVKEEEKRCKGKGETGELGEVDVPGSSAAEKAGLLSNGALLRSQLVSYAAHTVLRRFSALQVLLWQGHPGSAFDRYYNSKNC